MSDNMPQKLPTRPTLDKDLQKITMVEQGAAVASSSLVAPGIALAFIVLAGLVAMLLLGSTSSGLIIGFAAAIGAYMALNIGANDVANNVGPAVGAKALTMGGALVIAALCESAGALLAGGDVVSTISKGIIDPSGMGPETFVWAMMAALISSALWVNLATWIGAPVSTTHSVVGGVMGAGIAAAGFSSVSWGTMGAIAASWVISPVLGGIIAACFLAFINVYIVYTPDKIAAARKWLPVLIAIMAGAFSAYLALKGLKKIVKIDLPTSLLIGLAIGALVYVVSSPLIKKQSEGMENRNKSLRTLFAAPLVAAAALLSFAHGANDVANAVGPLAAVVHTVQEGDLASKVTIPFWVMLIGAMGISFGLVLFGPKLIRMVGTQITKLNPMRAYCVALAAAITVIVASWLGLPVSSTHIAVGAVFGVGFYREWFMAHSKTRWRYVAAQRAAGIEKPMEEVERSQGERRYRKLVRRAHFRTIVAAWIITVPAAAVLSAIVFTVINLFTS